MRRAPVALLVVAVGCLPDPFSPDVGEPLAQFCEIADSDPDTTVSWSADLVPLLRAECFFCHSPEGRSPIGIEVGRLDLSTYAGLRAGGAISGGDIVHPGDPCSSVLVEKLEEYPSFGARMPLNGPPFLSDAEIQLIRDWIAEGARED
jgi:hypothetical protein